MWFKIYMAALLQRFTLPTFNYRYYANLSLFTWCPRRVEEISLLPEDGYVAKKNEVS